MFLPAHGTLDDILRQATVEDDKKSHWSVSLRSTAIQGLSEGYLCQIREHISVGIGIYPKHARNRVALIDEEVRQLRMLLRHPRVVAFGEEGLDHFEPLNY